MIIRIQLLRGPGLNVAQVDVYVPDSIGVKTFQKALHTIDIESKKTKKKPKSNPKNN